MLDVVLIDFGQSCRVVWLGRANYDIIHYKILLSYNMRTSSGSYVLLVP